MKKTLYTILAVAALLSSVSCKDTYILYDTAQKSHLYFETSGSPSVSFSLSAANELKYDIPVKVMGTVVGTDREFKIDFKAAEPGETVSVGGKEIPVVTAVRGEDFEISGLKIPAGSPEGKITLTLKRTEKMMDNYASIWFSIIETDAFLPIAPDSSDIRKILTPEFRLFANDGEPACPAWWTASAGDDDLFGWSMYIGKFYPSKFL